MRRLRFLRILLPALLVPFLVFVAMEVRRRPLPHRGRSPGTASTAPLAEQIEFTDIWGRARRLFVRAGRGEQVPGGGYRLRDVQRVEVDRKKASPLVVSAPRGGISGGEGQRVLRLEGGVTLEDDENHLILRLPTLEIDEARGEARSLGEVRMEAPEYEGRAASLLYGLEGQPTEMFALRLTRKDGSTLSAVRAKLYRGTDDVELLGDVQVGVPGGSFTAGSARVRGGREGGLESLAAAGGVSATWSRTTPEVSVRSEEADARWDPTGRLEDVELRGRGLVRSGSTGLVAGEIRISRGEENSWSLSADGSVAGTGTFGGGPAVLTADHLEATLDENAQPREGRVSGRVRFEGTGTVAEAARARWLGDGTATRVVLRSGPNLRARLVRERSRVSADTITTDPAGERMIAEGRVEATLLPAGGEGTAAAGGRAIFRADEAVHFVAARLESRDGGARLVFTSDVRGWQGDRNLSADRVELEQEANVLVARGHVNTRFPRQEAHTLSEQDYIQVGADRLRYDGKRGVAVYTGEARLRQAEGWMEARRIVADLQPGGSVREIRSSGGVRFEYRAPGEEGLPKPVAGEGDRLVYRPGDQEILLYGEQAPASVHRGGPRGGTTTGRVLRYRLDLGTLEVESGEGGRGRIRTGGD